MTQGSDATPTGTSTGSEPIDADGSPSPSAAPAAGRAAAPERFVLELEGIEVHRGPTRLVGPLDWRVECGERWVVVGPNGSGKTTLLRVASTYLWPSRGRVTVLGERIGAVDARQLRRRIGYESPALAQDVSPELSALDVVVTARTGALAPWWDSYAAGDIDRARMLLDRLGCGALVARAFGTLSSGERQRVQIARALMPAPDLLLLDEPAATLDLGAREDLIERLADLARDASLAGIVLVTHHLEEIPPGFGRALVLRDGAVVAGGPIGPTLTDAVLSEAFATPVRVVVDSGRYGARRA
jgi:iron complex transport system ATP-binding protein